jgi:hypothetical protein
MGARVTRTSNRMWPSYDRKWFPGPYQKEILILRTSPPSFKNTSNKFPPQITAICQISRAPHVRTGRDSSQFDTTIDDKQTLLFSFFFHKKAHSRIIWRFF